jgi:ubiquinone/menaquinone biosynthesis C-methylase UbiE
MNCDSIAPLYLMGERLFFGHALDRCRTAHLPALGQHEAALVCGDGDGRFLRALVASRTATKIDYVDVSRRMTALARKRLDKAAGVAGLHVEFFSTDIRELAPARGYDLIATHFFLDCFGDDEIREVVEAIAGHAAANATWLVSEFQIPPRGLARYAGSLAIRALYATFRILTGLRAQRLPDYRAALSACGFTCAAHESSCGGLLTSQVWRRRLAEERPQNRISDSTVANPIATTIPRTVRRPSLRATPAPPMPPAIAPAAMTIACGHDTIRIQMK